MVLEPRRCGRWIARGIPGAERARWELAAPLSLWSGLFLLILCLSVGRSVGSALFLDRFESRGLAASYLVVGAVVAGVVAATERWGRGRGGGWDELLSIGAVFLVTTLFAAAHAWAGESLSRIAAAAFYLLMESFTFLSTLQFWAAANSRLTLEQASRIYIFVATGGILGGVAGGSLTLLLAPRGPTVLLLILAAMLPLVAVALLAFRRTASRCETFVSKPEPNGTADRPRTPARGDVTGSRESPTLAPPRRLMRAFGMTAMGMVFATTLVDFYFKRAAYRASAGEIDRLTSYFGGYYLAVGAATLAAQVLFTPPLLRRGGPAAGLALSPLVLGGTALWNLLHPALWSAGLMKILDSALSHSVYRSCQEVLYTPLPSAWIWRLKLGAEGVHGRYGLLLAGGVLLAAGPWLENGRGRGLLLVLLAALAAWALSIVRLRRQVARHAATPARNPSSGPTAPPLRSAA